MPRKPCRSKQYMPVMPIKYSTRWQRGKLYGYISRKEAEFRVYFGKKYSHPSKGFRFSKYGETASLEKTQKYLIKMNQRFKMASNRWRWCDTSFSSFEMKLTKGKTMIVDRVDLDLAEKYHISADRDEDRWYARVSIDGKTKARLARLIMHPEEDKQVDHINGNTLDNRRNNLRVCSQTVNMNNRKLSKNSTTLLNGISKRLKNGSLDRYIAHSNKNGQRSTKSYSVNKYGQAEALRLATEWRQSRDEENNCSNGQRQ